MDTMGGAQIHVRDLSNHLVMHGYDVSIISGPNMCIHELVNVKYFKCLSLKRELHLFNDVRAFFEVRQILKLEKPDLVATHSSKGGIIGRLAAWSLRIPTVFTAHGWAFTEGVSYKKRKLYAAIEKSIGLITKQIIAVSEYDRQLAISSKVVPAIKIKTIRNGVIPFKGKKMLHSKDKSRIDIVMVARFDVPKRQQDLIQTCEKMGNLPWHLSFVGDGKQLEEAQHYVRTHHLQDRIFFHGALDSIEMLLSHSDIVVLLSDYEGFPLSILEAMQAGLPIVASDVGGVKEAVTDTYNGFLIPKRNHPILLDRLTQLLTNTSLRKTMGLRSRLIFNENFTFEKMLHDTIETYKNIIEKK